MPVLASEAGHDGWLGLDDAFEYLCGCGWRIDRRYQAGPVDTVKTNAEGIGHLCLCPAWVYADVYMLWDPGPDLFGRCTQDDDHATAYLGHCLAVSCDDGLPLPV